MMNVHEYISLHCESYCCIRAYVQLIFLQNLKCSCVSLNYIFAILLIFCHNYPVLQLFMVKFTFIEIKGRCNAYVCQQMSLEYGTRNFALR